MIVPRLMPDKAWAVVRAWEMRPGRLWLACYPSIGRTCEIFIDPKQMNADQGVIRLASNWVP
jgi:hypothetical protein